MPVNPRPGMPMQPPVMNPVARPVMPGPMPQPAPMSNIGPQVPGIPHPMANTQPIAPNPMVGQLVGALRQPNPMMRM